MTTHELSSLAAADLHSRADEAAAVLRAAVAEAPRIAIVLGSGLNELAGRIGERHDSSPTIEIPAFPADRRVAGHAGQVSLRQAWRGGGDRLPGPIPLLRRARPRNRHLSGARAPAAGRLES